jgi:hypothetical protein
MRGIPLSVHGALEMLAAPAIMVAPFPLGFGPAATIATVAVGVLLLGLAVQAEAPQPNVPLSAHAGFDYALAALAVLSGLAIGAASGEWYGPSFLIGVGAAQVALTVATRFSQPRSV